MSRKIRLFYWSSIVFENNSKENYGDSLSAYIVSKLSGKEVFFYNAPVSRKKPFKKRYLMAIGSILQYATARATVWGSGIISKADTPGAAHYCAVRGPLSRKRILQLGHTCPEVYGDPAILLLDIYAPEVLKKHALGIVPHYLDYKEVKETYGKSLPVINLITNDFLATTNEILSRKAIISSSLHGLIVAHTYEIPAIWVQFSGKLSGDNTKYADYFMSVGITPYEATKIIEEQSKIAFQAMMLEDRALHKAKVVRQVAQRLKAAFPKAYKKAS